MDLTDMASYGFELFYWIFNEKQFLPHSVKSWDDVVPLPGEYFPRLRDIALPSIIIGTICLGVRTLYERFLVVPFAMYLGIKHKTQIKIEKNPILEEAYIRNRGLKDQHLQELCKKTSLSEREIQRWFRQRKKADSPGDMKKFCECSWQFLFYVNIFCYGVWILWDKPWLWNVKDNWENYPFHPVSTSVYYYYLLEASYLWNMMFFLFYDHKRKDFKLMAVHHMVTMLLILLSWYMYYVRIGTMIMLLHDASDIWMLAAKLSIYYDKNEKLTTLLFVVFTLVWTITRLIWFPWLIYTSLLCNIDNCDKILFYVIFGSLLTLQLLHIVWSFMIAKIVVQKLNVGKVKDVRSDSEEDCSITNNGSTKGFHSQQVNGVNGSVNDNHDNITIPTKNSCS